MTHVSDFLETFGAHTVNYAELREWFTPERQAEFWSHVDKQINGCWVWTGRVWDTGYGRCAVARRAQRTHRLAYMLTREQDIPAFIDKEDRPLDQCGEMARAVVRHVCGNRPCCCPRHLVLGTDEDNRRDQILMAQIYRAEQDRNQTEWDRAYTAAQEELLRRRMEEGHSQYMWTISSCRVERDTHSTGPHMPSLCSTIPAHSTAIAS